MRGARKIIHIDMDAFYAAVEQRDQPRLRGRPVVVGGPPQSRGVVATASYEARVFGIHSAMPTAHAYRLCPQATFIKPRFEVYRQASRQIHAVLVEFSELIEPLSLDEAYLDVSHSPLCNNSATRIASAIRQRIFDRTGLTASAGISYNKFLAKLASDINKPDGQYVITPAQGPAFIERLRIGQFHGIGKATEAKMNRLGIYTGADLKAWPLERLLQSFGKLGQYYYSIARGIDQRPVQNTRERKSVSSETTFAADLTEVAVMLSELDTLAAEVADYLAAKRLRAHTLTIKVKYADFRQITRSQTVAQSFYRLADMRLLLPALLARTEAESRPVRLLGVGVSNLEPTAADRTGQQLELF